MRFARTAVAAIGGTAMLLAVAGCIGTEDKPPLETIPAGPEISPSAEVPTSGTPAPTATVNPAAACVNQAQVVEALIFADPDVPPPADAKLSRPPVCEAGWAYAAVAVPGADENQVVLRHTGGKWTVLTFGSAPCSEPRVGDAPAKVRTAAGC